MAAIAPSHEYVLAPGRSLGGFVVVKPLGHGAMSEVYEVKDEHLGVSYALKLFTLAGESGEYERFVAEGRLLAHLAHPRIVRVRDVGCDEVTGRPYFVMDLVLSSDGTPKTLADATVDGTSEEQVATWYEDLREGLAYIHGKGVLHRDLKLQNVLVGPDGHVVLVDFGIAKILDAGLREHLGLDADLALTAIKDGRPPVMGSVGYFAPEVEMGVAASPQSDWYSLGVLVFHLLTGLWCDSRTNVVAALETYGPEWREILPALLHANPAGRKCDSVRDVERRLAEESSRAVEEECDVLRRKAESARKGRTAILVTAVFAIVLAVASFMVVPWWTARERSVDFDDLFPIPHDVPDEESVERFNFACVDAWVLLHRNLLDLSLGKISIPGLADRISSAADRAEKEDMNLFADVPFEYSPLGDYPELAFMLYRASAELYGRVGDRQNSERARMAMNTILGNLKEGN